MGVGVRQPHQLQEILELQSVVLVSVELVEDYFGSGFRGGVGSVLHFADFFVFLVGIFEDVLNVVNWILEFYLFGFQTQVLLFLKKE